MVIIGKEMPQNRLGTVLFAGGARGWSPLTPAPIWDPSPPDSTPIFGKQHLLPL